MRSKLMKIKEMVLFELENRPETRGSDRILIYHIYNDYYGVANLPFLEVLQMDHLPNFESIRRCRAKAQEVRPDLRPDDDVISFREDNQQAYFDFMTGGFYD